MSLSLLMVACGIFGAYLLDIQRLLYLLLNNRLSGCKRALLSTGIAFVIRATMAAGGAVAATQTLVISSTATPGRVIVGLFAGMTSAQLIELDIEIVLISRLCDRLAVITRSAS